MTFLAQRDRDLILHVLLQIDDPAYLQHFQSAAAEEHWLTVNEALIQRDLQAYFPSTIDTTDPETWRYIRGQLKHT